MILGRVCETYKVVHVDGILSAAVCTTRQTRLLAYKKGRDLQLREVVPDDP